MEREPLNKMAVWSLVLALLFFTFIAAILGHVSLSQIKKRLNVAGDWRSPE